MERIFKLKRDEKKRWISVCSRYWGDSIYANAFGSHPSYRFWRNSSGRSSWKSCRIHTLGFWGGNNEAITWEQRGEVERCRIGTGIIVMVTRKPIKLSNKIRILVVDDDRYSVLSAMDILLDMGILVFYVQSCSGAISELEEREYDVVVLDIMMNSGDMFSNIESHGGLITGKLMARIIRDMKPDQKILAYSLHVDAGIQEWFANQERMWFVRQKRE